MKAEELMIGDWVNFHLEIFLTDYEGIETVHDEVLEIGKVSALNSIGNVWVIDSEGEEHQITNDEIEPIPLTTEILEKNGFYDRTFGYKGHYVIHTNEYQLGYYPKTNRFGVYKKGIDPFYDKDKFCCGFKNIVKYVHELQHALKLCGIKNEIIL